MKEKASCDDRLMIQRGEIHVGSPIQIWAICRAAHMAPGLSGKQVNPQIEV